ncbi:MAG: hypothetical protein V4718_04220 [Pseudomonadota bacterium]
MPIKVNVTQKTVPRFGVIVGGLLDGWNYSLLRVTVTGGQYYFEVAATPPNWVFPMNVRLAKADFLSFTPGKDAKVFSTQQLIDAAVAAEGND